MPSRVFSGIHPYLGNRNDSLESIFEKNIQKIILSHQDTRLITESSLAVELKRLSSATWRMLFCCGTILLASWRTKGGGGSRKMTWWQWGGGGLDTPQKWWRHLWTAPNFFYFSFKGTHTNYLYYSFKGTHRAHTLTFSTSLQWGTHQTTSTSTILPILILLLLLFLSL